MQPPHNGPCPLVGFQLVQQHLRNVYRLDRAIGIGQFRYNHRHPGPSWYRSPPSPPPSPPSSPSGFRSTTGTGRTPPRWTPCETCPPAPSARGPVQPPASRSTRAPLDFRVSSNKTPFSTSIGPEEPPVDGQMCCDLRGHLPCRLGLDLVQVRRRIIVILRPDQPARMHVHQTRCDTDLLPGLLDRPFHQDFQPQLAPH